MTQVDVNDPLGDAVSNIDTSEAEEQSQIKNSVNPLMNYSEKDNMSSILKKNVSGKSDILGGITYHIKSNNKGLRDENFDKKPPEDTYRVLIVGDSLTFGWGLNKSERYTEVLEKRLNRNRRQKYQVINAGIPGWGLKDYYSFLRNRGQKYKPDIIIVGLIGNDFISNSMHNKLEKEARREMEEKYEVENLSDTKYYRLITNLVQEKLKDYREKKPDNKSDTYIYPQKIQRLSQRKNTTVIFYQLGTLWTKSQRIIGSLDINYLEMPEKIRENPENYHFEEDPHYNAKGHSLLANKLYTHLQTKNSIPN
jgi:lysophospholipase L1-like esterase